MWSLEYPVFGLLFLFVPVLIYLVHFRRDRGGKLAFNFHVWPGKAFTPRIGFRRPLAILARILFWFGACMLIFALCGPVIVEKQRHYLSRGVDMILAVDVSPSMSVIEAAKTTRLEATKEVLKKFIGGRENDGIGLVAFGNKAALRIPPTMDYSALLDVLDSLQIMELGEGTAIGMGIMVAVLHLHHEAGRSLLGYPDGPATAAAKIEGEGGAPPLTGEAPAAAKVIILMTDGDNNAGEISPEEAAAVSSALNIRLYTIGIGREGEFPLKFTDPKTGKQYSGLYTGKFNEDLLKQIARQSGGRYFRAGTLGILDTVFEEIDALETTEKQVQLHIEKTERHYIFILLGILLILLDFVVRRMLLGELF